MGRLDDRQWFTSNRNRFERKTGAALSEAVYRLLSSKKRSGFPYRIRDSFWWTAFVAATSESQLQEIGTSAA